jgi:hypothetical protein
LTGLNLNLISCPKIGEYYIEPVSDREKWAHYLYKKNHKTYLAFIHPIEPDKKRKVSPDNSSTTTTDKRPLKKPKRRFS